MSEVAQAVIAAARQQLNTPAIMHQAESPLCWLVPYTLPTCMEVGLGKDGYDCAGLVDDSIAKVYGIPVSQLTDIRHTRQIWRLPQADRWRPGYTPNPASLVGKIAVMGRIWTMPDGQKEVVPAHIAFVTDVAENGMPIILEAHAGEAYRRVVERPVKTMATMLGTLPVEALCDYALTARRA